MSVNVYWDDDEKTRLLFIYENDWTWSEATLAQEKSLEMLTTVNNIVDIMVDIRNGSNMPPGALSQLGSAGKRFHSVTNTGIITVIGADRFIKMMGEMFKKVYPEMVVDTYFVENAEEARSLITTYREEIADRELF